MASITWQYFHYPSRTWMYLGADVCRRMERAFGDPSVTTIDLVPKPASCYQCTFDVDAMLIRGRKIEYPFLVRRNKNDAPLRCAFFDPSAAIPPDAYVDFDSFVSTLIIDAKAAGRSRVRFYLGPETSLTYEVALKPEGKATQTNAHTGFTRAVYIPYVAPPAEAESSAEEDETIDHKALARRFEQMPPSESDPLTCPITYKPMLDPVVAADGFTYDKTAITKWFSKKNTSPLTGKPLLDQSLRPNRSVLQLVRHHAVQAESAKSDRARKGKGKATKSATADSARKGKGKDKAARAESFETALDTLVANGKRGSEKRADYEGLFGSSDDEEDPHSEFEAHAGKLGCSNLADPTQLYTGADRVVVQDGIVLSHAMDRGEKRMRVPRGWVVS